MPGFYPEDTITFTLPIHADLPEAERPRYTTRFLTARDQVVVERAAEESLKAARENRDDDYLDQLDAAVKRVVVAGDHLDFDAHLADQISIQDMWDLYEQALAAQRLRRDQMGKSESPSPSVTEQSVPNAAAADASTSPAQPNPSSSPA